MYKHFNHLLAQAALALLVAGSAWGQGETTEHEFVGRARQADSLLLGPGTQSGDMTLVVDDTIAAALVMVTSSSKTLSVSLIDPNLNETFVGNSGPGISGSTTYPENADSDPNILGKDYAFRLESPAVGTWTVRVVETMPLSDDLIVVTNSWMESEVQGFVVGGSEDYPPAVPVRLGIFMMNDTGYLSGYSIDCQVFRLGDASFTPVNLSFSDDGQGADFAAADGLFTGEVSLSSAGEYDMRATVQGTTPGGQAYERDLFAEFRIVLPGASLVPSTVTDQPLDDDGDTLIDRVLIQNDVDVVNPGDYVVQVDLFATGGASVSSSSAVTLPAGVTNVAVEFSADELRSLGEDGPYEIRRISLLRVQSGLEEAQGALFDLGFTAAYLLSDLEREPILVSSFTEFAEDCGSDGDYDRLMIDVVVDVLTPGVHQYSTTLTDIAGNEIVFFSGARNFVAGPNLLQFEINAFLISARGGDGPYSLSSALILGPVDSLVADELGSTQTYLHSEWQAPPTTFPVFADLEDYNLGPISGQLGWTQTLGADPQAAVVSSSAPHSGSKSIEMHIDPLLGSGVTWGIFSPQVANTAVEQTLDLDVRLDGSNGPSYDVLLQNPSNGLAVAWMRFAANGDVLVYQSLGGSFSFVPTGYNWLTNHGLGTYFHLHVRVDTLALPSNRVLVKLDGITVFTGPTLGSTFLKQVVLLTDNVGPDAPFFADNLVITNRDTRGDCNNNGEPDSCDISSGNGTDCNGNGILDQCDISTGTSEDCNFNGLPDECDLASGTSQDCNQNGVPDDCDTPDCDSDGIPDDCEIDCDGNGAPDECEIVIPDCNENLIPDICEPDCDGDTIPDDCEADCNLNGIPDDCDLNAGTSVDCNGNGVPDECDLASGTSPDCNGNDIPDECDIASGTSLDCNANTVPDECDLASGSSPDCNANNIPDECDIASGQSQDANTNDVPDECECAGTSYCVGAPNSVGAGAVIGYTGSLSVSVNDTVLTATGLPPGQFGIFFYGPNQIQIPFGNGFRCVGGQLFRLLPPMPSDGNGENSRFLDMDNLPHNGDIDVGDTWYFQHWYRDPMGGGAAFNLSDALVIRFCE